jgi:muramoyltetrapeptide carboxypeptidase
VKEYKYPVCFGFPSGHMPENYAMKLGMQHELIVTEKQSRLLQRII